MSLNILKLTQFQEKSNLFFKAGIRVRMGLCLILERLSKKVKKLIIGHRGLKGMIAENTAESFKKAKELGLDGVELDVRKSADGEVVVFHDKRLDRMTNARGLVRKKTLAELRCLRIGGGGKIMTLAEALQIIGPKMIVDVEIKEEGLAEKVGQIVDKFVKNNGFVYSNFVLSSSSNKVLREIFSLKQLKTRARMRIGKIFRWRNAWELLKNDFAKYDLVVVNQYIPLKRYWLKKLGKSNVDLWIYQIRNPEEIVVNDNYLQGLIVDSWESGIER